MKIGDILNIIEKFRIYLDDIYLNEIIAIEEYMNINSYISIIERKIMEKVM